MKVSEKPGAILYAGLFWSTCQRIGASMATATSPEDFGGSMTVNEWFYRAFQAPLNRVIKNIQDWVL